MNQHSYNIFFETISVPIRLKILYMLQSGPMNVTEICKKLGEEQSKVSHNLKSLTSCHFLTVEQKGKHRVYSLNKETIIPLMEIVEKHVSCFCNKNCEKCKKQFT